MISSANLCVLCGEKDLQDVGDPFNTILHLKYVEIQEQAELLPAQLQICQQLRLMNRDNLFYRFKLYDNGIIYKQVNPVTYIDCYAVILYRQNNLARHIQD